jgi:hypothetical protein
MFETWFEKIHSASTYRATLDKTERELRLRKLAAEVGELGKSAKSKRRPLSTYVEQLTSWHAQLPPESRKAPRAMQEFLALLKGRSPGLQANAGEVSKVLFSLGWRRIRVWKKDGEGRRLWLPPSAN